MFDERKLKELARRPKKEKLDRLDKEAEAEAKARRFFKENEAEPETLGRRISKTQRQENGNRKTAEAIAEKNQVKLVQSYIVGEA